MRVALLAILVPLFIAAGFMCGVEYAIARIEYAQYVAEKALTIATGYHCAVASMKGEQLLECQ